MAVEGMVKCGVVGVGVGAAVAGDQHDDMGDGMQCSDHPYRSNPGGICAFCLQEKLGKLVSSSFPLPGVRASSSSSASSPNSFRSDHLSAVAIADTASKSRARNGHASAYSSSNNNNVPFLLSVVMAKKKKKKVTTVVAAASSSSSSSDHVVFKRSKSTATPRRGGGGCRFLESASDEFSPRKRGGFWSFLHLSSYSVSSSSSSARNSKTASFSSATSAGLTAARQHQNQRRAVESAASTSSVSAVVLEENDTSGHQNGTSDQTTSFERKVSRSRSVGCGSRSFSGDFFERISTGFGDCTLRRVESQREGKPAATGKHGHARDEHCMKERVRCGGLFGGFTLTSSSSSSSYWDEVSGPKPCPGPLVHGRTRSWGWAFASPIRAFTKPSGPNNPKRDNNSNKSSSTTPNLSAIPSLLAVRS